MENRSEEVESQAGRCLQGDLVVIVKTDGQIMFWRWSPQDMLMDCMWWLKAEKSKMESEVSFQFKPSTVNDAMCWGGTEIMYVKAVLRMCDIVSASVNMDWVSIGVGRRPDKPGRKRYPGAWKYTEGCCLQLAEDVHLFLQLGLVPCSTGHWAKFYRESGDALISEKQDRQGDFWS